MRIISKQDETKPIVTQGQLCLYNKGEIQYSREKLWEEMHQNIIHYSIPEKNETLCYCVSQKGFWVEIRN